MGLVHNFIYLVRMLVASIIYQTHCRESEQLNAILMYYSDAFLMTMENLVQIEL